MIMGMLNLSAPKWLVFLVDVLISVCSTIIAYFLRFNFDIPNEEVDSLFIVIPFVFVIRSITFFIGRTFVGILRYTGNADIIRIATTVTIGSLIFCITDLITFNFFDNIFNIPFSIIIIDFGATTFFMIAYRFFVKISYLETHSKSSEKTGIVIYGAGESGVISKRTLDRDLTGNHHIIAFVDDNDKKSGRKLEGIKVHHTTKLEHILSTNEVDHIIISIQNLHPKKLNEITEMCLKYNTKVLNVPPVSKWINGELSLKQIKGIKIEDLLGRDPIKLDIDIIEKQLNNKVILVTGSAGSIGSGLVFQLLKFAPKKLILFDQAETPLYLLETKLNELGLLKHTEIFIGDIRNENRVRRLFKAFNPQIVFHAAAYKHVPLMEMNPSEAILTNVLGSKILADLSVEFSVERFVMISTDKAVNPTNIMGASKRIAEMYCQGISGQSKTNFITTRFGNVLGSNGSVIPLFKRQIESGGPITVTDPDVTRYFMTIPEACQLVLEAGAIGNGGEIFLFNMGKSVKIVGLAKKMIKLSGLELGKDIQIIFTGLRPGEKLFEELLNDEENTIQTHHPQIMKAKVAEVNFEKLSEKIDEIINSFDTQDNDIIVGLMKSLVPEFKSENSVFKKLDVTTD